MQTTFKEAIGNNNSKDKNCEMLDRKLSRLTGFDVEVQISPPNMCSHDKHSARQGALHTAVLIICLCLFFSLLEVLS